jgi:ferredoxin-NADP reductase
MLATDATVAAPRRLQWLTAQVSGIADETPRVKTLLLDIPGWPGHRAGQHVDIRLTGEDGYQAQRSYSIASAPEEKLVALTVERIEDGEVSPYLTEVVQAGDKFELRGPIGGHFVWTAALGGPLYLIAGGSGIAPLMAMLRHRAAAKSSAPAALLYSSRSVDDIICRGELDRLAHEDSALKVMHTLTRQKPPGWTGGNRRIDMEMLENFGFPAAMRPRIFICGPTPLVESAARLLSELGHEPGLIKTERFGPTGA